MVPALAALLANGLPLLGNALLSVGGKWIQDKTGVDVQKAMLSQEDLLKLRQFEMEHEEELLRIRQEDDRLQAEIEMAYLKDVQSARTMQGEALKQDDLFSKRFIYYFAILWSVAAGTYLGFVTFGEIPVENVRFADTILGFLLGMIVPGMFNFFYGSSKSSQAKDSTIQSIVQGKTK